MSLRSALVKKLVRSGASLRARVLGQQRTTRRPDIAEDPFTRTGRVGIIQDAVEYRQQLAFFYSNSTDPRRSGRRVGNPHGVYKLNGKTYLLMWTLPGSASGSRRLPGWRTFLLNRVQKPQIIVNRASFGAGLQEFRIAPGYRRFRRGRYLFRV